MPGTFPTASCSTCGELHIRGVRPFSARFRQAAFRGRSETYRIEIARVDITEARHVELRKASETSSAVVSVDLGLSSDAHGMVHSVVFVGKSANALDVFASETHLR